MKPRIIRYENCIQPYSTNICRTVEADLYISKAPSPPLLGSGAGKTGLGKPVVGVLVGETTGDVPSVNQRETIGTIGKPLEKWWFNGIWTGMLPSGND